MGVFEAIGTETHEEVLFGADRASGLRTIIAIHDTSLGPALGGTRFYPYADEDAALRDVDGGLADWARRAGGARVILVRPDRQVYGVYADPDDAELGAHVSRAICELHHRLREAA